MAITFARSGDRWGPNASSVVPKQFVASRWIGGAAGVPAVGQLVKQDTTTGFPDGVVQCVASDVPYGMVLSINSSDGILSVLKFIKTFSVVFEAASGVTAVLGHQIQANGSPTPGTIPIDGVLRDAVKDVASAGIGTIVAVPTSGSAPYLIVVEFGS